MTKEELSRDLVLEISPDILSVESRCKYTFAGAYIECYEKCTEYWHAASTHEHNNAYLKNVILPALTDHNSKTIDQYSIEDFEDAIEQIKASGQLRAQSKGIFQPYQDSSIQTFRNIIARTIRGAALRGLCDDIFKDSYFLLTREDMEKASNSALFVQKSISLSTEIKIIEDLLSDYTADGEIIGFLLVVTCGLRLNESAAVNWGNIVELKYHPDEYKLLVFESTMINSTEVKSSGKTPNANRAVPLFDRVVYFLLKRKEFIASAIKERGLDIDINQLPIACVKGNYFQRCSTKQISDKAREIFIRHQVKPKTFQYADLTLRGSELCEIKEKNPTGYLGRHIFATHLALLDLNADEIQAIFGHDIEDPHALRSDFNSDERLHEIKKKMDRMPIYKLRSDSIKMSDYDGCISGTGPLSLQIDQPLRHLHVSVETEEPFDALAIECQTSDDGMLIVGQKELQPRRGIDVMGKYSEVYRKLKESK